jgi:hypothetical protein
VSGPGSISHTTTKEGETNVHNICLYHCQYCGHVVEQEPNLMAPFCCGGEMIKAAEDTVLGEDEYGSLDRSTSSCEDEREQPSEKFCKVAQA